MLGLCFACWLPQCMQVTEGIEVDVAYQPEATPAEIRTDLGYGVRLSQALIAIGRAELVRCEPIAANVWELVGPGRARAHEMTTPTSLGTPLVIDLMESGGAPLFAGTLRPPPGTYCGIRIVGMPADEDAPGLTENNLVLMQHSVWIEGHVQHRSDEGAWPVEVGVSGTLPCELRFEEPWVFDQPTLESVAITIDHTRWFDGVDFARQDALAAQRRITENIIASLKALPSQWERTP